MKAWDVLDERIVIERPWLTVREQHVRTARGVEIAEYHLLDTLDWVCAACITHDNQVVLVRQYRHGVAHPTLELPAGAINAGEDPLAAVKREVLEETGYTAQHWTLLRSVYPETTRHRHRAFLFLATGAVRSAEQTLDPTEDVDVHLLPWTSQLPDRLEHSVHVLACYLADLHHPFVAE